MATAFVPALIALAVEVALVVIAALLVPRAKVLAITLGVVAGAVVPWLAGPSALLRGIASLIGLFGLLRILDLVRTRARWTTVRRVLHVLSLVDTRTLERAPPRLDLAWVGRALVWTAVAVAGAFAARSPVLVARWLGGVVLACGIIDAGYATANVVYRIFGLVPPPLHVWPLASLTVSELWGTRWARPISTWLREHCFRPFARRRQPLVGLMLGFVVSGVGHGYPVYVATDATMGAMMLAFFLVQGVIVLLETRLGVAKWPRPARRAWTIVMMLGPSPLFVEPALRVIGW